MEIELHHKAWPQLQSQHAVRQDAQPLLDWQGLRARLMAAHALRREVAAEPAQPAFANASFNRSVAHELAALCDESYVVNPTALGDGKGRADIGDNIAGAFTPGDRG
jgi:hypothetical protein